MYTALRATTRSLIGLLSQAYQNDPELSVVFNPVGSLVVSPNTPEEMQTTTLSGLSVWLYQVVRDEHVLNDPPRRNGLNLIEPHGLPLRLHYLMTPHVEANEDGSATETEQAILGLVLQTFNDNPKLTGAQLLSDFSGTDTEINVRLEALNLEEITRVWDSLESAYQLSVSYEVSIINIESNRQPVLVPPVDNISTEFGLIQAHGSINAGITNG